MSSASRVLIRRSSALRPLTRSQGVPAPRIRHIPGSRRTYVDIHDITKNTSETPFILGAVGVTVLGLAYLTSGRSKPKPKSNVSHKHKPDEDHGKVIETPAPAFQEVDEPQNLAHEEPQDQVAAAKTAGTGDQKSEILTSTATENTTPALTKKDEELPSVQSQSVSSESKEATTASPEAAAAASPETGTSPAKPATAPISATLSTVPGPGSPPTTPPEASVPAPPRTQKPTKATPENQLKSPGSKKD
ncbi:hypothetical protein GGR50DRAFT_640719 [Xylaria sp. CBS 124048]|nr:hypothetical protein GGR50DRAFT_640719 [Xylaria sp. CBS 124048]